MIKLTQRQELKVLSFANKGYTKLSELADKAREASTSKKRRDFVNSGMKLGLFLGVLDDKRTTWSTDFTMRAIDNLINEFNLFQIPVNTAQLDFNSLDTRLIGSDGGDVNSEFATLTQLNAESLARINQDQTLQDNIDAVNQRVDDLDFTGLVPSTVVFSEETVGYKDFPTELGINLPNKSTLDQISSQKLTDLDANTAHRGDADIHVTLTQKNDWNSRVTPAELASGLSGKANSNHTHTIGQIQSLQSELNTLAQSIIDNAAEDGITPNISIGSVVSGTTPSVTLAPASTLENPILNFVLVKGDQGDQGDPFEFGAIDFLANRSNFSSEYKGFSFVDIQTGLVYYKLEDGVDSWSGGIRTIGDRGWTPLHALEPASTGVFLKLVDYFGGQGVKPTDNIGFYLGTNGYVTSTLAAVNLKGNKGDSPVAGVDYELPRFKIDDTVTYQNYLDNQATNLSSQAVGYTLYIDGSVNPYENKNGKLVIIGRNGSGAKIWEEYEFKGDKGEPGVPGAKGDKGDPGQDGADGDVPEAPIDGTPYSRQDGGWVAAGTGDTSINDTNLEVIVGTELQPVIESVDSALVKARGTEVFSGGVVSFNVGETTFDVSATVGQIKDATNYYAIDINAQTDIALANTSAMSTWVYIDNAGSIQQQTTEPSLSEFREKLFLTRIATVSNTIAGQESNVGPAGQYTNQLRDLLSYLPSLKKGLTISPNTDLTFETSSGSILEMGVGGLNSLTPNIKEFNPKAITEFFYVTRDSTISTAATNIDVNQYDNNGTLTNLANNRFRVDTVYYFNSGNQVVQLGQEQYTSLDAAETSIASSQFVKNPAVNNGTRIGWIIVQRNATDLSNTLQARFIADEGTLNTSTTTIGALLAVNNLSDLDDPATARTNLDVYSKDAVSKLIKQTIKFLDIGEVFEYTQASDFRINSLNVEPDVTVTIKLSDGTTDYTLGDTVTAWDFLIFSVDTIGAFEINGEIL